MDYDLTTLPEAYDRGRDHGPEVRELWMRVIASHVEGTTISTILDLGCGTGRFSQDLAHRFQSDVIGIDPSVKMLNQARDKRRGPGVRYGRGTAEDIPLVDGAVDMIFVSMSFHHFRDRERAARECRRVLRLDGTVVVRTGTRERIASYPYVPFFPQTHSLLEDLLPDHASLRRVFEAAGFRCVASELITQTIALSWSAYADKLLAGGDSVLSRLSDVDFARGLGAVRRYDAQCPAQPVVEPIDVFVFR